MKKLSKIHHQIWKVVLSLAASLLVSNKPKFSRWCCKRNSSAWLGMQYVVGFTTGSTAYLSRRLIDLYAQPGDWPSLFGSHLGFKQTLHIRV